MSKITLTDLVNLENQTTTVNAINANNAILETALDNTLSRDGTSPNAMNATLDMNSHQIINLPAATSGTEPATKAQLDAIGNGYLGNNILLGTANQINIASGGGTSTFSLPSSLTFTGKTVTGGTFSSSSLTSPTLTGIPVAPTAAVGTNNTQLATTAFVSTALGGSSGTIIHSSTICTIDGVADCAPALRSAMTTLSAAGGGTLWLDDGTHLIKTLDANNAALPPLPNVTIRGNGDTSILKLNNNMLAGLQFMWNGTTTYCDHFVARDFKIDMNGANNQGVIPGGGYISVGCYYGHDILCENILVENNPGTQAFFFGHGTGLGGVPTASTANRLKIKNCRIHNLGWIVNPNVTDSSAIFALGDDHQITGNQIWNDTQDIFGTGIEVHGSGIATGNIISRCVKGFNVGAFPETNFIVDDNKIYFCYNAVTFWNWVGGPEAFQLKAMFSNNHITQVDGSKGPLIDAGNWLTSTGFAGTVKIHGNHCVCLDAIGGLNISPVINVGQVHFLDVRGNYFEGCGGRVMQLDINHGVIDGQTSIRFNDNDIINCCTTSNASYKNAVDIQSGLGVIGMFSAHDNHFQNLGATYMNDGIHGTATVTSKSVSLNLGINLGGAVENF